MADTRTTVEKNQGYPPSEATMIRRCTVPIVGAPSRYVFDQVVTELTDYLNTPNLTPDDLFAVFRDGAGSFVRPSVQDTGPGRWLKDFGLYADSRAAQRLIDAQPQTWLDILRVAEIGPDTFYDMFQQMTVRWVHRFGESLGVFIWPDGLPVDGLYFGIEPGPGIPDVRYVRVSEGLPFEVDTGVLFAFPELGVFSVASARPTVLFADELVTYTTPDLAVSAASRIRVNVGVAEPVVRIGLVANSLRVYHDPNITKLSIHPATALFPAKHRQQASGVQLRDKNANPCGTCSKFAFVQQEDLEQTPFQTVTVDPNSSNVVFHDLPANRYLVAGYSAKGSVVTTVRDVLIDDDTTLEIGMDHTFDLSRILGDPPPKAFLQGDIIRQDQRDTQWCGPFSLAHAFSYWGPQRFNPREDNGKWAGETIRDRPETWLHTVIGIATLGLSYLALELFADDPVPGTLQETMVRGCHIYGFSSQGLSYKGIPKADALKHLKGWIYAGVPVIVTVDEKMDQGEGHWSSEHYKTLVGYDDDATLRYTDDDGNEHTSTGAFYFANSGGMGENRGDPEVLSPELREIHADYNRVPIGSDADSYTVFWRKWQTGGIPTFSKTHWCIPVFPINFERVYGKGA